MNKFLGATIGAITIAGALILCYLDYTDTEYICDKCNKLYKPQPVQWTVGMHLPTRRHMKCPHCGNWGWHKRVHVPDTRDFFD